MEREYSAGKVYAWVYYGVKALCLLVVGFSVLGSVLVLPITLAPREQGDLAGGAVSYLFSGSLILTFAAGVCALVLLLWRSREMGRRSTWIMALVLAVQAWFVFSVLFGEWLPVRGPGDQISHLAGFANLIVPPTAAWGVYVVLSSVLTVVADRSQRPVPSEGTSAG